MGYCMTQEDSEFRIKKKNFAGALKAIKALANIELMNKQAHGGSLDPVTKKETRWYSWVDTKQFVDAKSLEAAIKAWRWEAHIDKDDIDHLEFAGEKLGDDEVMFKAIAPFVEAGSYIHMAGEDGYHWKWDFNGKDCMERSGKVVFE